MINKRLINTGEAAPAALDPLQNFETVTYTGNGSTQKITGYIRKGAAFASSGGIKVDNFSINATSFSISLWINVSSGDNPVLRVKTNYNIPLSIQADGIYLPSANSTSYTRPDIAYDNGSWNHLVVTNSNVYLNGSNVHTFSGSVPTSFGSDITGLVLGNSTWNLSGTAFGGRIDQVRIFNRALLEDNNGVDEIQALADETYADPKKSTTDYFGDGSAVALYQLDEDANDTGSYPYGQGDIDSGQSAVFNGSSSRISISAINGLSDVSVSCWLRSSNSTGTTAVGIIELNGDTTSNGYAGTLSVYYKFSDGLITIRSGNASNSESTILSHTYTTLRDGDWHNLIVTRNESSGVTTLYIDGSQVDQESVSQTSVVGGGTLIGDRFTGSVGNYNWDGQIDQVRIYSSVLSALDVEALVSETNVPTANLVAHYKLDGNGNDETTNYNATTVSNITYSDPAEFPLIAYNGTPTNVNFLGMAFQPDLVWIKGRTIASNHALFDVVRGNTKRLESDNSNAESTYSYFNSFDANGFTVGNQAAVNSSSTDYVAWCWKAGGAAVTNTDGTITSTVSANPDAGFSIVKYTAGGTANVGHGLSQAPELIINKSLDGALNWVIYSADVGTQNFGLFTTAAFSGNSGTWSAVDANTFTTNINSTSYSYINYCFHSVDGYQKVGSYTGVTGNKIITTGFRPRFLLVKNTSTSGNNWNIMDSTRDASNPIELNLWVDTSDTESTATQSGIYDVDFNDDGFTIKNNYYPFNFNGETYIYLAIA